MYAYQFLERVRKKNAEDQEFWNHEMQGSPVLIGKLIDKWQYWLIRFKQ